LKKIEIRNNNKHFHFEHLYWNLKRLTRKYLKSSFQTDKCCSPVHGEFDFLSQILSHLVHFLQKQGFMDNPKMPVEAGQIFRGKTNKNRFCSFFPPYS
jgi:hypothetical protein